MLLFVIHPLWSIIGDSGFVVSLILPSTVALLSFHRSTGKLGSRPVAHILNNEGQLAETAVKRRLQGLLGAMGRYQAKAGTLAPAVGHFFNVSRSYWPGLFHCYSIPQLPRTNNDLEQFFGAYRYHERRTTGRKVASPAVVLRGAV